MCEACRSKYLETYWESDVEMLAKELHEAGRKAFESGTTVAQAQQKDKAFPFVEWDALTEQAKEGKRIQARHLIEKFRIELPHGGERAELQAHAAKPKLLMWERYAVDVDFEALRKELNAYMGKGEGYDGLCLFPGYDPMRCDTLLGYVYGQYAIPPESLNKHVLLYAAAENLEALLKRGTGYLAIIKRHIAKAEDAAREEAASRAANGAYLGPEVSGDSFRENVMRKFTRQE